MNTLEKYQTLYRESGNNFIKYYLAFAQQHQTDWKVLAEEEIHLILAVQYCYHNSQYETFLILRDIFQPLLDYQGRWLDALTINDWAKELAAKNNDLSNLARFIHDQADILNQSGNYAKAETLYSSSEREYLQIDAVEMALRSRHMRSMVVRAQGRYREARLLNQSTISEAQKSGLERWLAHPLYVQGLLARDLGNYEEAESAIIECIQRLNVEEESAMYAQCLHFRGELAMLQGKIDSAESFLEQSLKLSQGAGILRRVAATQRLLGEISKAQGDTNKAKGYYWDAYEIADQVGDQPQKARILLSIAKLSLLSQPHQQAAKQLRQALEIYRNIGDLRGTIAAALLLMTRSIRVAHFFNAIQYGILALQTSMKLIFTQPALLFGFLKRLW